MAFGLIRCFTRKCLYIFTILSFLCTLDVLSFKVSTTISVARRQSIQPFKNRSHQHSKFLRHSKISYTEAVANEKEKLDSRTVPSLTTSNFVLYQIQVLSSIITFCIGVQVGISVAALFILPSLILFSHHETVATKEPIKTNNPNNSDGNVSTTSGGSRTAILALYARSQMYLQSSGGPDYLAPKLLDRLSLFGSGRVSRQITLFCGLLSRVNFRLTKGIFEDQVAFIATLFNTGLITPMHVRTCFLDDCIETFVRQVHAEDDALAGGTNIRNRGNDSPCIANVVILGSGFDTRCYRLNLKERNLNTFEVDATGTQIEKRRVLREAKIDESGTVFCPCDFETEDWFECLVDAGLDASLPTMLIWEGVTMYLPKEIIVKTLKTISVQAKRHSSSWYIGFDYINEDWAMSLIWREAMKSVREPFKFAMSTKSNKAEIFVQSCGLEVLEHLRYEKEMARRYIPEQYSGRTIGVLGDYGGFIVARSC